MRFTLTVCVCRTEGSVKTSFLASDVATVYEQCTMETKRQSAHTLYIISLLLQFNVKVC